MTNSNLANAKKAKNDEFYTQWNDIQKEISAYIEYDRNVFRGKTILLPADDPEWSNFTKFFAQKFEEFGLKKLISTSYAADSKNYDSNYKPTSFEKRNSKFDKTKTTKKGKIFTLTEDKTGDGKIDVEDLEWEYLGGDGDFRSDEIKKLRDEADIIITNPPFSLFREFLVWIIENDKQFIIIGSMNAITYKEVFPLIKENKMWLGVASGAKSYIKPDKTKQKMGNTCWFTNIDHGRRHQPLQLMTMKDNLRFNKKLKERNAYKQYDNYNAIEVPFTNAIPSDFDGVMGVPISFLDKYDPDQFDLLGSNRGVNQDPEGIYGRGSYMDGKEKFKRIFIKHKKK